MRSPSRFLGVLRLPGLRSTGFHRRRLRDGRTWCERVLSLKHRGCNETNKYHRAQQSPHENDRLPWNENPHGRTSGDEERSLLFTLYCTAKSPYLFRQTSCQSFFLQMRQRFFSCPHFSPAVAVPTTYYQQLLAPPVPRSRCNDCFS